MRGNRARAILWLLPALIAGSAAAENEKFCKRTNLSVVAGEVREGDVYFAATNADITGTLDGDMIGFANATVVNGEVTGDLVVLARTLECDPNGRLDLRSVGGRGMTAPPPTMSSSLKSLM